VIFNYYQLLPRLSKLNYRIGQTTLASRVSVKLDDGGIRGAIRLASSEDTLAPYNSDTIQSLRLLHPARRCIGRISTMICYHNMTLLFMIVCLS